jgi:mRNA interferase YafQ
MVKPYIVQYSSKFQEERARLESEGRDKEKLEKAMDLLVNQKKLPEKYSDHPLKGRWRGFRDLHLDDKDDWILVYKYIGRNRIRFERTGSHAEIFGVPTE